MYKFQNLNQALIGMSEELMVRGRRRKTRGFDCVEMPYPVIICITNPSDRHVTIPERKWNKVLPFIESLWIALGVNDLDTIPGHYVKSLYNFSDDGKFWRGGYGTRIRAFTGNGSDYKVSDPMHRNVFSGGTVVTDQLKYVIESFKRDINTRQAIIEIGDPAKDCFGNNGVIKVTKDFPCTRSLHFQVNTEGAMDLVVDMRSNDILWGFSAVNVFNFTFIQEYVANIVGVPVGNYYHKADNLHYYENFRDKIEFFSNLNFDEYPGNPRFFYDSKIESLEDFDDLLLTLLHAEKEVRENKFVYKNLFKNDMFEDWYRVIQKYWGVGDPKIEFKNPHLQELWR